MLDTACLLWYEEGRPLDSVWKFYERRPTTTTVHARGSVLLAMGTGSRSAFSGLLSYQ